jgi:hypothetical protein
MNEWLFYRNLAFIDFMWTPAYSPACTNPFVFGRVFFFACQSIGRFIIFSSIRSIAPAIAILVGQAFVLVSIFTSKTLFQLPSTSIQALYPAAELAASITFLVHQATNFEATSSFDPKLASTHQ